MAPINKALLKEPNIGKSEKEGCCEKFAQGL